MNPFSMMVLRVRHLNRLRVQARRMKRQGHQVSLRELVVNAGGGDTAPDPFSAVDPSYIRLRSVERDPLISIVIAAYGKPEVTLRCLYSLAATQPQSSYEVIVIEDASGDSGADLPSLVEGVRFIQNPENLGYLRSCNKAAQMAKGRFLLMLNNDTELLPGAIDELMAVMRSHPEAGLVGSKLIYPDGRLQEAGCIVWADGTAWNYGRLQNPHAPSFNYLRDVDYCSAASILIRRDVWVELGGFDELYLPAYCEDLDLALRVHAAGYRVLYAPRSTVIHHEGVSHGTDTTQGLKQHQVSNQAKVAERWSARLLREHYDNGTHLLKARDHARQKKTLLFVDHYLPEPDRDAGSRSTMSIIDAMLEAGWVVKFWPDSQQYVPRYAKLLEDQGVEVLCAGPGEGALFFPQWLAAHHKDLDGYFLSRPTTGKPFLDVIRKVVPKACVLFYGHDLHFARLQREQTVLGREDLEMEVERMLALEKSVWSHCDVVFYPSTEEAQEVRKLAPEVDARRLTPYHVTPASHVQIPGGSLEVLFVAGFKHPPNVDAAMWLVEEVMPKVWASQPQARLVLAGSHPTEAVRSLANSRVVVTGTLSEEELARCYRRARVAVIPLRFGAGVKFKTVEAMARGLPLVTTSIGVQGLDNLPEAIQVKDDKDAMACAVLHLLEDDAFWSDVSRVQRAYVAEHFRLDAIVEDLLRAIELARPLSGTGSMVDERDESVQRRA